VKNLSAAMTLLALTPLALGAQEIIGTLRLADGRSAAGGVIVVAQRRSGGAEIVRVMTNSRGEFRLKPGTDEIVLVALRIGQQPFVLDTLLPRLGQMVRLDRVLPERPVEIASVRTAIRDRCGIGSASRLEAVARAEDAQIALASSIMGQGETPVSVLLRVTQEEWTPGGERVVDVQHREYRLDSLRALRSIPPDSLHALGFTTRVQGQPTTYRVPDAAFFADTRFATDHCLTLTVDSARPRLVGVSFKPSRFRRVTQLSGTFWMDRESADLRRIEFRYEGLDPVTESAKPGGWIDFTRLPNGLIFASRWSFRMPRVTETLVMSRQGLRSFLVRDIASVAVTTGEVLDLATLGTPLFSSGAADYVDDDRKRVSVTLTEHEDPNGCISPPGTVPLVGVIRGVDGSLPSSATVQIGRMKRPQGSAIATIEAVRTVAVIEGSFRTCDTPSDEVLWLAVTAGPGLAVEFAMRIPQDRPYGRIEIAVGTQSKPHE